ncbi:hypothetical protein MTP99_003892 [Tenebrio molitor]|nr:hypothetical protein MTP99_003892 [Tenebrio molitor]
MKVVSIFGIAGACRREEFLKMSTKDIEDTAPVVHDITPSCGFKVKGRVRRRCKDCYMVMREQRMYVLCKTHPRHKQMTLAKDPKNTWILSHATQGKVRPW